MQGLTRRRSCAVLATLVVVGLVASTASCGVLSPKSSLDELVATQLTTETYPWFVVHGIVASSAELSLRDVHTGAGVNAVDYLTAEHELIDRNGRPIAVPCKEDGL